MTSLLDSIPTLFDISYFPESHHGKCADISDYIERLVKFYLKYPGKITQEEMDSMMLSLSPVFDDPTLFMYQFLLMLNSLVTYGIILDGISRVVTGDSEDEDQQHAYL